MTTQTPDAVREALHDADCISGRIHAGGYRANLSDVETLRNHVRRLAAALDSRAGDAGEGVKHGDPSLETAVYGECAHHGRFARIAPCCPTTPAPAVDAVPAGEVACPTCGDTSPLEECATCGAYPTRKAALSHGEGRK